MMRGSVARKIRQELLPISRIKKLRTYTGRVSRGKFLLATTKTESKVVPKSTLNTRRMLRSGKQTRLLDCPRRAVKRSKRLYKELTCYL